MKIEIENNKIYLSNVENTSLGDEFIYKYPQTYMDFYTNKPKTRLIDRIPFKEDKLKRWEFPSTQWLYSIKKLSQEKKWVIENPEVFDGLKSPINLLPKTYHLWANQITCLNEMLSFRHGIGILRTGAGKTTMISVLTKNLIDLGFKVLVMAPTNGVLQELRDRYKKDFNVKCDHYFDPKEKLHFVNPRGMFKSNKFWLHDPYWKDIDCIIFDEVENCMNDMFLRVLDRIPSPTYMYGFSGTANKVTGGILEFTPGKVLNDNHLNLLTYLGWTSRYEKPEDRILNIIRIEPSLDLGVITKEDREDPFNKIVIKLASNKDYHSLIKKLFDTKKVRNLFIPFVSRVAISEFLKLTPFRVGLITGSGCQTVLVPQTDPVKCTLDELKDLAKNNKLDIIIGSRSAFAGIDLPPNWNSSLANAIGNLANSSVQAAGRVSRATEFNLFWFTCKGKVPVFNTQVRSTIKLMKSYYSESEVIEKNIK